MIETLSKIERGVSGDNFGGLGFSFICVLFDFEEE